MWITVKFIIFVFIISGDDASSQVPGVLLLDGRTVEGLVGRAAVNCEDYKDPSKCVAANCQFCCETWKCSSAFPLDCATGCPSYCADEEKCWKHGCHYDRKNWKCSKRNTCKNNNTDVVFAVNLCGESVIDQAGIWYQKDDPSQFHPEVKRCTENRQVQFPFDNEIYVNQYHPSLDSGLLHIPVWQDGHYQINMKFVELYKVHRVFSILINGQPLITDLYFMPPGFSPYEEVQHFYIKDLMISVKDAPLVPIVDKRLEMTFIGSVEKEDSLAKVVGESFVGRQCMMSAFYVRRIGDVA